VAVSLSLYKTRWQCADRMAADCRRTGLRIGGVRKKAPPHLVPAELNFKTKPPIRAGADPRGQKPPGFPSAGCWRCGVWQRNGSGVKSWVDESEYCVGVQSVTRSGQQARGVPQRTTNRESPDPLPVWPGPPPSVWKGMSRNTWDRTPMGARGWRAGEQRQLSSRFAALRGSSAHREGRGSRQRAEQWLLVEWPLDKQQTAQVLR